MLIWNWTILESDKGTLLTESEPARVEARTDPLTPEQRRYTMSRVKGKDTEPELAIRKLVHSMGYRYRLHRKDLPGKPDIVFPGRRKVIFANGCFWHSHDCRAGRNRPKTNLDYWHEKLEKNKKRDLQNQASLLEMGWDVLVVWECEVSDNDALRSRITNFLEA